MKKKFIVLYSVILSFLFVSCDYGWSEFFGRGDEVNERSSQMIDLDSISIAPSVDNSPTYSVVLFSDMHVGITSDSDFEDFKKWVSNCKTTLGLMGYPVKFLISLGDVTNTGASEEYDTYRRYCKNMEDELGLKTYSVVGNHDLYNSGWKYYKSRVFPYSSCYKFTTSAGGKNLSWYFFDTASGTFGSEQIKAMKSNMARDPNEKLVFTHYPLFGNVLPYYILQNVDERDFVVSFFAKNRVRKVFNGHTHIHLETNFGDYFTEHTLASFKRKRACAVLKVDQALGVYSYDCYEF